MPNDSTWSQSWWLYQDSRIDVHAPEAWDLTHGDSSIVVALIDTGMIPYHPDLGGTMAGGHGNVWNNPAEANGVPGVDDDGNGFVDDVWGWDFVNRPFDVGYESPGEDILEPDGDPNDFVGHGTIVAGLVGAITDNRVGVVGMDWNVRLMELRVGWSMIEQPTGFVLVNYIAQAVRYATLMGAKVINISLSSTPLDELSLAVDAAIAAGVTVVVAAGNNGSPHGLYPRPGLIYVAATDRYDVVPRWSNVGDYVSLCAPGADMISTNLIRTGTDSLSLRQPGYAWGANGTSFATPVVSGAVALLQSYRKQHSSPLLKPEDVRLHLMATCDDISAANPTLPPAQYGAGRLNVRRALDLEGPLRAAFFSAPETPAPIVVFTTLEGERRIGMMHDSGAFEIPRRRHARAQGHRHRAVRQAERRSGGGGSGRRPRPRLVPRDKQQLGAGLWGRGQMLPGWPLTIFGPVTPPALGDIDDDSSLDVVCVGPDARNADSSLVWVWNVEGRTKAGFPVHIGRFAGDSVRCALANLDGHPGDEIVAADAGGWIHAIRSDGTRNPWLAGIVPRRRAGVTGDRTRIGFPGDLDRQRRTLHCSVIERGPSRIEPSAFVPAAVRSGARGPRRRRSGRSRGLHS